MADRRRALQTDQTGQFVVYDRRTGEVLTVHHVTALAGVPVPSDEAIVCSLRAFAAKALGRRVGELGILRTQEAPAMSPDLRVDVASGKLRNQRRSDSVRSVRVEGTSPAAPVGP